MTHTRKYELIAEHLLSNTAPWFLSCRTYLLLAPCRFSRWTVTFNFSRGRVFRRSGQRNDGSVPWIKAPKSQNKFKKQHTKITVCLCDYPSTLGPEFCRRIADELCCPSLFMRVVYEAWESAQKASTVASLAGDSSEALQRMQKLYPQGCTIAERIIVYRDQLVS